MSLHLPDPASPSHGSRRPDPARAAAPSAGALHYGMFGVDIVGFGRRPAAVHPHLRSALYRIIEDAFAVIDVPLAGCYHEDRGDGILVIPPAQASVELLLGPLTAHLQTGLRRHNQISSLQAQLRIRTAVNAGYLRCDSHGVSGHAVLEMFRLLDSDAFNAVLTDHNADLGMITSHRLYEDVIADNPGVIDPDGYLPITVAAKETTGTAWIWLPPLIPRLTVPQITAETPSHMRIPSIGPSGPS